MALRRHLASEPFYTFYSFGLASGVAKTIWDMDLLEGYPQIATVMARMAKHPSVARVEAEKAIQPPRYCCWSTMFELCLNKLATLIHTKRVLARFEYCSLQVQAGSYFLHLDRDGNMHGRVDSVTRACKVRV